ncbi:MAG: hypothetical protein OEU94_10910 [Aquincola sp.]|nr:hypothetical protein [Aquincola sp.]MDH4289280.1 hypothetical protein [Aquincola sp.]MDH5331703.1 hypothetical protein [Aquincola sp.]
MKRLVWIAEIAGPRLLTLLAIVLLATAAALHVAVLAPLQTRVDRALAAAAAARRLAMPAEGQSAAQQLQLFYRQFGNGDTLPDHLARLYQVARATGITLRQADYKLVHDRDSPLKRYQIVLPIRGSYVAVRLFVSIALESLPNVALDQVSFERRRIDESEVDAQIRLTLYLPDT